MQAQDYSRYMLDVLQRANEIADSAELDELLDRMMDLVCEVTGAEAGTFYLYDAPHDELIFKVVKNDAGGQRLLGKRIGSRSGIVGAVLHSGRPEYIPDVRHDPRWNPGFRDLSGRPLTSSYCLPLLLKTQPIGVLQIFNLAPTLVDDAQELALVRMLAGRMASEVQKTVLLAEAQGRERRLQALVGIIGDITTTLDRDSLLDTIMNRARELLDTEATSIWTLDEQTGDLVLHIATGERKQASQGLRVPAGQGIIGRVVASGRTMVVQDVSKEPGHYAQADAQTGMTTRSILCVPLKAPAIALGGERGILRSETIGGVQALNKRSGQPFSHDDVVLLETLANQAATVWQLARLYRDTDRLFTGIIEMVTGAIDLKDPYTRGHSQRVSEYSVAIARELRELRPDLDISDELLHHIRIGGILHDLGKIGVDDAVLRKAGKLTDDEYAQMKQHPTTGASMVRDRNLDWLLRVEIHAMAEHHERLDGRGYPLGLGGDQISLIGRIVAVADVFDAVTSDRPYRKGSLADEAIAILRRDVGTHFDAECVEALVCAREKGLVRTQAEQMAGT